MSTAVTLALLAVTISLGAAFVAAQSGKAKRPDRRDGGDSSVAATSDGGSIDCPLGDSGGGCDGGGGGGD